MATRDLVGCLEVSYDGRVQRVIVVLDYTNIMSPECVGQYEDSSRSLVDVVFLLLEPTVRSRRVHNRGYVLPLFTQ